MSDKARRPAKGGPSFGSRDRKMSLRVAVQMDPLERINIAGDSTFAIMLGAQARGHRLYHYAPEALSWADGRLWTKANPVSVRPVEGDHHSFGETETIDLGR